MPKLSTRQYETSASQAEYLMSEFETSRRIVEEFSTSEDFLVALHDAHVDPDDRESYEYAGVLSGYAAEYVHKQWELFETGNVDADNELSRLLSQVNLIANIPRMLHESEMVADYEAERRRGKRLNDADWQDLLDRKDYAIWYNQLLSDYLYNFGQDTRFSDVIASLSDGARDASSYSPEDIDYHVRSIARGARTEAISRQLLDKANVPYRPSTIREDARGGDVIALPRNKPIKIDLKTSPEPIAKLLGHGDIEEGLAVMAERHQLYAITYHKNDKYGSVTIYLGLTDEQIGNACLLTDEQADEHSTTVAVQLMRAFMEMKL